MLIVVVVPLDFVGIFFFDLKDLTLKAAFMDDIPTVARLYHLIVRTTAAFRLLSAYSTVHDPIAKFRLQLLISEFDFIDHEF